MSDPQMLAPISPRRADDAAAMALAVQANLVALKVACARRAGLAPEAHAIRTPPPGAVLRFRETLIDRHVVQAYRDEELWLRTRQVWGEFALLCWAFECTDPHQPVDFHALPASQGFRCPAALLTREAQIARGLWRLRHEQRLRFDPRAPTDPRFQRDHLAAVAVRLILFDKRLSDCSDADVLAGACEYAGMLAAVRWLMDDRWSWEAPGIMELGTVAPAIGMGSEGQAPKTSATVSLGPPTDVAIPS